MRVPLALTRSLPYRLDASASLPPDRPLCYCWLVSGERASADAGSELGQYRLERELGSGAMGVVWLARDARDGADVALKLLRPELSADEVYRLRFLREARI